MKLRIHLDIAYFAENWKHCSKIIFKCMNSVMELIFNEKVARKKKVCGSHEQCTGPTGMYCPPLILLVWTIHWQTKSKRNTSPKKKKVKTLDMKVFIRIQTDIKYLFWLINIFTKEFIIIIWPSLINFLVLPLSTLPLFSPLLLCMIMH